MKKSLESLETSRDDKIIRRNKKSMIKIGGLLIAIHVFFLDSSGDFDE